MPKTWKCHICFEGNTTVLFEPDKTQIKSDTILSWIHICEQKIQLGKIFMVNILYIHIYFPFYKKIKNSWAEICGKNWLSLNFCVLRFWIWNPSVFYFAFGFIGVTDPNNKQRKKLCCLLRLKAFKMFTTPRSCCLHRKNSGWF